MCAMEYHLSTPPLESFQRTGGWNALLLCGVTIIALASFAPTEKSLTYHNIDKILTEVLEWYNLGTKLGLPGYKLGEICQDHTGTVRQRQEMISKWLAYDTEASWNKLARALEEIGMRVVAKEILEKYVSGYKSMFAGDQHVMIQTFSGQGMLQSSKLLMRILLNNGKMDIQHSTCHYSITYT